MSSEKSINFLRNFAEPVPQWLRDFKPGQPFNYDDFASSRVAYYPGCGDDGHLIRVFNQSGAAHCFLMVDYGVSKEKLDLTLKEEGFVGYSIIHDEYLNQDALMKSWTPHFTLKPSQIEWIAKWCKDEPYARFIVYERESDFGLDHGAERFAVVFMYADGIATYDALFCQADSPKAPYCILIHDHGWGGNYDRFGKGGLMEQLHLKHAKSAPQWLFVNGEVQWKGYELVKESVPRSMWRGRYLYQQCHKPCE